MVSPNLDARLGLHQEVEIIYVVDGYQATLRDESGSTIAEGAVAPSVALAVMALEMAIQLKWESKGSPQPSEADRRPVGDTPF